MALNLSRNTKVFVSSVNGVGATGGVKTCHVSTAGSGYAVGDIVTLGTTSGSGVNSSGNTILYMAWADQSAKYSNAF